MSVDYITIGKKLEKTRENRDLTQKQLANKLEITVSEMEEIEKGNLKINLKQFINLCNILNISIFEVFDTSNKQINSFMDKELYELIIGCDYKKQKLIYNMVKLIVNTQFA